MIRALALFLIALLYAAPTMAATITGVTVEVKGGTERLRITADASIPKAKYFALENPDRIVIDIPTMRAKGVKLPANYKGTFLRAIRFAQFSPTTSRIVLDLGRAAEVARITPGKPLVIELTAPGKARPAPSSEPKEAAAEPPARKKPLIAIDAGHGGQDPGAIGLHKTQERDVTLNFAKSLAKALEATGNYRAMLTRDENTFIMLHDRVNIARKAKADIFISIHADSNPNPDARGLSIYTLSSTASDAEAAALAERENKSDIITGLDLNTTDQDVANILIDLTQRETMNKSTILADSIVDKLHPNITRLPSTHRYAGFRVLKAPDTPSVLIELGFLSNVNDERLLLSPDYRDLVVSSVIKGIDRFYSKQRP